MTDEQLIEFLEHDQLNSDTDLPVPRAPLGRAAATALWTLRAVALILSAMVVYAFVYQVS